MATPDGPREESEEADPEFTGNLAAFHAQRGTPLDLQPRVNGKQINLQKLFDAVVERGGYDVVSAEKLAWRKVGQEFGLGASNAAAYAFALKTVYYKNLAAYEIKTIHNQEPPPKEILESLTAKGGDLLKRTVENFRSSSGNYGQSQDSDASGDESRTPKDEKMDLDDPGSSGRTTRGLRQAPPQRVLFQPEVTSSRQTRHSSGHLPSPQPTTAPTSNYSYSTSNNVTNLPSHIANYEPRPPMPLTLKSVTTPINNPQFFKEQQRRLRDSRMAAMGRAPAHGAKGMMKPGQGFDGPNIYVRTLQGLRSGIPDEEDFALHHLVKISHERGDKYKFEAFPNLAESLIEYALRVSSLFYDVKWQITYFDDVPHELNELDGLNGTPDILQRIRALERLNAADGIDTESYTHDITKIHEAGLTVRNLALLEDNAIYLANLPQLRDFLAIVLSLPPSPDVTELKHYALDIAEQVTKHWSMPVEDPLYQCLLSILKDSSDRGAILTALQAISRISLNLQQSNVLRGVPDAVIERIFEWTLLQDDELVNACLDFLYQFTAIPENVAFLLSHYNEFATASFLAQLTRLLQHGARPHQEKHLVHAGMRAASNAEIVTVPKDLLEECLKHEEPQRSNCWLRAVFEEDAESDVTQIALWQAYQAQFSQYASAKTPLLQAADFIKNVSTVFSKANAQIVAGVNKFIMKGIRPRHVPATSSGRSYLRCLWSPSQEAVCGQFCLDAEKMYSHIASTHLGVPKKEDGSWDLDNANPQQQPLDCYWAGCLNYKRHPERECSLLRLGVHVKTHIPDPTEKAAAQQKYNRTLATQTSMPDVAVVKASGQDREAVWRTQTSYITPVNELREATGIPLISIFVLRNIARNIPKAITGYLNLEDGGKWVEGVNWVERLFGPLRNQLFYVVSHNFVLAPHVLDLLVWIDKGST